MQPKPSTNHAIVDVSEKLFNLWATPVKQDLLDLSGYLERPLNPDWKIPMSHAEWKKYLYSGGRDQACHDQDLGLLFKQCEDEIVTEAEHQLKTVIMRNPDMGGTEDSFHGFWDNNIRNTLELCLKAKCIRNSNQGTELRPDFGLLLADSCAFRGEEEKGPDNRNEAKNELKDKMRWPPMFSVSSRLRLSRLLVIPSLTLGA
jgi:hypothetical protein